MGGLGGHNPQVRMNSDTKDAAIAYAKRHGLAYHLVPAPPVKLRSRPTPKLPLGRVRIHPLHFIRSGGRLLLPS